MTKCNAICISFFLFFCHHHKIEISKRMEGTEYEILKWKMRKQKKKTSNNIEIRSQSECNSYICLSKWIGKMSTRRDFFSSSSSFCVHIAIANASKPFFFIAWWDEGRLHREFLYIGLKAVWAILLECMRWCHSEMKFKRIFANNWNRTWTVFEFDVVVVVGGDVLFLFVVLFHFLLCRL